MIKCRALAERSIFVTSKGDILPCCYMYDGGPNLTPELKAVAASPNFKIITDSWSTTNPFPACRTYCDDSTVANPSNLVHFDKQWKNNATEKNDK